MGTLNPKNKCSACSYTWYPRGKALSLRCPSCDSTDVKIVRMEARGIGGVGIAIAALVVFAIFKNSDKEEVSTELPRTEQLISVEQSPAAPAPASSEPIQATRATTGSEAQQEVTSQRSEAVEHTQNPLDACADVAAKAKEECAQGECTEAIKQSVGCTSKSVPTNMVF